MTAVSAPLTANDFSAVRLVNGRREAVLAVNGLTVLYDGEPVLEDISFEVMRGDSVAIIGPNGAGKSTLMKAIMGLLQPQSGRIAQNGSAAGRFGYIPQHEEVNWDFPVTVRDVVMMGCIRQIGWFRLPRRSHRHQVDAALARVAMSDFADRQIGELSGGQRRRVFIARALAQEADILLLDEPFSGVDASAQASLLDVLASLHHDGLTLLLSTHDLGLAFNHFDKVLALSQRLVAFGPPNTVYTPDTLARLYGGKLATISDGQHIAVYVDDHSCSGC